MKRVILFFLSLFLVVGLALSVPGQASSEPTNDSNVQQQEPPAAGASVPGQASSEPTNGSGKQQEPPSTGAILGDFIFIRPFGIIATALGVVGTVVTLPIAIPSGSTGAVAKKLIAEPFALTFTRPLGAPFKDTSFPWP